MEINNSFTLRNEPDRSGKFIVYLLLTHQYRKKLINTKIKVDRKYWKNNRVLPGHEGASDINLILGTIEGKINKIKVHWRLAEKQLTIPKLVEEFQSNTPDFDFISFFRHHLEKQDFAANTHRAQKSILTKLEAFRPNLPFSDINEAFFLQYKKHLKKKYGNNDTTIQSNFKTIKKYLKIACDDGVRLGMDVKKLKVEKFRSTAVYLFPGEVAALKKYFSNDYLNPAHRLPLAYFLTACYTGMRISDLQKFKSELVKDRATFNQVKTNNFQSMKLNKEIRAILEKTPEFFTDNLSDQKINAHLKTIADVCKIEKNLTMHVARHTFATTWLRNGGSLVKLQKLLGHTDIKTTMVYSHILEHEALEGLDEFITY